MPPRLRSRKPSARRLEFVSTSSRSRPTARCPGCAPRHPARGAASRTNVYAAPAPRPRAGARLHRREPRGHLVAAGGIEARWSVVSTISSPSVLRSSGSFALRRSAASRRSSQQAMRWRPTAGSRKPVERRVGPEPETARGRGAPPRPHRAAEDAWVDADEVRTRPGTWRSGQDGVALDERPRCRDLGDGFLVAVQQVAHQTMAPSTTRAPRGR